MYGRRSSLMNTKAFDNLWFCDLDTLDQSSAPRYLRGRILSSGQKPAAKSCWKSFVSIYIRFAVVSHETLLVYSLDELFISGQIEGDVLEVVNCVRLNFANWLETLKNTWFVLFETHYDECLYSKLLDFGLNVIYICRPSVDVFQKTTDKAGNSPGGKLILPCTENKTGGVVEVNYGVDVCLDTPEIRTFLLDFDKNCTLVLSCNNNTAGETDFRASIAMDVIVEEVLRKRKGSSLFCFSPADSVYPIPLSAVEDARYRYKNRPRAHTGLSNLFGPFIMNEPKEVITCTRNTKKSLYMFNGLRKSQGVSQAFGNLLQIFRVILARAKQQVPTSCTVMPFHELDPEVSLNFKMEMNRYRGLKSSFPPITALKVDLTYEVLSLIMLYDLCAQESKANPDNSLGNPMEMLSTPGFHGGLWRSPYQVDSLEKVCYAFGKSQDDE